MGLTKAEIIDNYYRSVIPLCNDELIKFCLDVATVYDAFWRYPDGTECGAVYKNLTKALKAYEKYGFNETQIDKYICTNHTLIVENTKRLKSDTTETMLGFRHKAPYVNETITLMK